MDGQRKEHSFPREELPNLQALLKDSLTQTGWGATSPSPSLPKSLALAAS